MGTLETSKRIELLQGKLRKSESQFLLVTNFTNVTYLTGFTGDDSYLLVGRSTSILISDARYEEQIGEECPHLKVEIRKSTEPILDAAKRVLLQSKGNSVLVEGNSMSISQYQTLKDGLPGVSVGIAAPMVEELRETKDSTEIASIRRAIGMAERSFVSVRNRLTPMQTELDLANELESSIRQLGGRGCAFRPIVGVGPRAALPHGKPSVRRLHESPFVLIDWGANEGLYLSDLTRVLITGKVTSKFVKIYQAVLDAHRNAANALRAGAKPSEIDLIARDTIQRAGFGKRFTHGLGHGFGLQIHESPRLAKNQEKPLAVGMVVTIEPGIYIPGWGGVRIEDDYLIGEEKGERLTSLPQDLEANIVNFL